MTPLYAGVVDAHMCEDCGLEPKAGRSYRCEGCRRAHRTRQQTRAQAQRRARARSDSTRDRAREGARRSAQLQSLQQRIEGKRREIRLMKENRLRVMSLTDVDRWLTELIRIIEK